MNTDPFLTSIHLSFLAPLFHLCLSQAIRITGSQEHTHDLIDRGVGSVDSCYPVLPPGRLCIRQVVKDAHAGKCSN
jgi:hypothetical protein